MAEMKAGGAIFGEPVPDMKINEIFTSVKTVFLAPERHKKGCFCLKHCGIFLKIKNGPSIIIRKKYLCSPDCSESDFCACSTHYIHSF